MTQVFMTSDHMRLYSHYLGVSLDGEWQRWHIFKSKVKGLSKVVIISPFWPILALLKKAPVDSYKKY